MKIREKKSPHHSGSVGSKVETRNSDPETVLLAVTGMSPAILTETIWALARQQPPVIPNRVVAITTSFGSAQIQKALFTRQADFDVRCPYDCLRDYLAAHGHDVTGRLRYEERILRIWNEHARRYEPLTDIRTRADNDAAADFIIEQVRSFTEAEETHLIATIAGGRKTMGALLYACMNILGREDDRLTHVLVNEPYEEPGLNFLFPGQPMDNLLTRSGRTVQARNAQVELADVPFVPLRNLFERDLVKRPASFTALVQRCRKQVAEQARRNLKLVLWRSRPEIRVNKTSVKLSGKQHLLIMLLAEAAAQDRTPFSKYADAVAPLRALAERVYAEHDPNDFSDWRYSIRLPADANEQTFRKVRDELIDKLEGAGGDAPAL
ncbi:MAG: CRISPR-associated ring nuclease Csm6, partial [Verrucomicrobiales bacterium]|nr:CRISPR-associated ring nuclease Csm6 [Verrucomicrobiales bacterium]